MLDLNRVSQESVRDLLLDNETKQLIQDATEKIERLKQNMTAVQDQFSSRLTFAGLMRLKEILEISKTTLMPLVIKLEEKKIEAIERLCQFNNG
jgi:hypothetical protein